MNPRRNNICGAFVQKLCQKDKSFRKKQWDHKNQRRCKDRIEANKLITVAIDAISNLKQATAKSRKKKKKPVRAAAPTARYTIRPTKAKNH